jgi:hypothetical protein
MQRVDGQKAWEVNTAVRLLCAPRSEAQPGQAGHRKTTNGGDSGARVRELSMGLALQL